MAYEPTNWKSGDVVTSAKLNKMEQGIADGGVLVIELDLQTTTLNKTWQEIFDASLAVFVVYNNEYSKGQEIASAIYKEGSEYCVELPDGDGGTVLLSTDSADGYPTAGGEPAPSPFPNDDNGGENAM